MANTCPIIISVAPNGARKTKDTVPGIPLNAEELANEAKKCADAGAVLFHLHIRDDNFGHTLDVNRYRETIAAIREKVGDNIIVQTTTEAVGIYTPEQQMEMVQELVPEAASFAIREFIPNSTYEETARKFFQWVSEKGIFAQYILYSPEEVRYFASLKKQGIIPAGKSFVLFVLGKKTAPVGDAAAYARPDDLLPFVEAYDTHLKGTETTWAVCAFGGYENDCMLKAVQLGGNVRIGFENNHLLADGAMAPDNAALVTQFCNSLGAVGRPVATVQEVRSFFQGDKVKQAA